MIAFKDEFVGLSLSDALPEGCPGFMLYDTHVLNPRFGVAVNGLEYDDPTTDRFNVSWGEVLWRGEQSAVSMAVAASVERLWSRWMAL